ncbi:MAG: tRNA pseudouridine(55) synthase TruB [Clostridia bacterium]|nr:tRNA pseudouridine(55) synthase TruB [Clostridia bacterium]
MCGLLLINKPEGVTSFGVVKKIKKLTKENHVGHTGTLDPMATGVLPVLIGRATKLSNYMLCADKCYRAGVKLGITTDTLDITGRVIKDIKVAVTNEQIDLALSRFSGEIEQTPPMFSAVKKDGVRLYKLAREGKQVDIPSRKVSVFSIRRETEIDRNGEFLMYCHVSKGTYIRSLVRDIGDFCGTGAVLLSLVRTKTAGFSLENCVLLDELTEENINEHILPADEAVKEFQTVFVTNAQALRFSNGGSLDISRLRQKSFSLGEIVKINFKDTFLGLAEATDNQLKFKCIINPAEKE